MSLQPEPQMAVEFLEWLRPGGPWLLTALPNEEGNSSSRSFDSSQAKELHRWIEDKNADGKYNVYFHINPTKGPMRKKAQREDIAALEFLHVDIDPRTPSPDDDKAEHLENEQKRIVELLTRNLPKGVPRASGIISSGGGFWGLWRLEEPMQLNGDHDEAALYNLKLAHVLEGDTCQDVSRIARLPGTVNWPDNKKRKKGRTAQLATFFESRTDAYQLDFFEKASSVPQSTKTTAVEIDLSDIKKVESLDELPNSVKDYTKVIITQGHDPDDPNKWAEGGRSDALWYVCCELVRCGVSDEMIYSLITDPDWGISESVVDGSNGRGYAKRQIERARDYGESPELAELNDEYSWVESVGGACRIMRGYYDHGLEQEDVEFLRRDDGGVSVVL